MAGPVAYIPITYPVGERWRAVALEEWGSIGPQTRGFAWAATEAEAKATAEALCVAAKARRDAEHEAEIGELIETLPNGLQLRRQLSKLSRFDKEPTHVKLSLYDPNAPAGRGPYRGHVHNAWSNRKGELRWRLWALRPDGTPINTGQIKSEAQALRALRRAGMALETAHG